jgi:hypothetical protein
MRFWQPLIASTIFLSGPAILDSKGEHRRAGGWCWWKAIAAGLPLVASNVGGNSRCVIEDGFTGLLSEPEKPGVDFGRGPKNRNDPELAQRLGGGRARQNRP